MLSFAEAKLSVVEYDPANHDLKTTSMHTFEDEESKGGRVHNFSVPFLRADPDGRCAAMLVYGRKIIILPFRHSCFSHKFYNNFTEKLCFLTASIALAVQGITLMIVTQQKFQKGQTCI